MGKKTKAKQGRSVFTSIRILLLVTILVIVGLLLLASMLGGRFGAAHQLTLDFIGPIQSGVTRVVAGVTALKDDYIALVECPGG